MEAYLLTRQEAAERYGMSVRGLEEFYKAHPDFPLVRLGRKKVLVHREKADAYFTRYITNEVAREW